MCITCELTGAMAKEDEGPLPIALERSSRKEMEYPEEARRRLELEPNQAFCAASARCTAGLAFMRCTESTTFGKRLISTPSPSSHCDRVNRYGSQMVYRSPITHGPESIDASISSKQSPTVLGTLRCMSAMATGSSAQR